MLHRARRMRLVIAGALVGLVTFSGCATNGDPRDPLEPLNRGIYTFNDGVDTVMVKPAAEIYQMVIPPVARTGVSNFFSNLNDVTVAINNLLQGKFSEAMSDTGRLLLNSTAGLFGLFDVATVAGLEKHEEDFGQTLGWWGVGDGPYLVLPILGPRTTRDTAALIVDWNTAPVAYVNPVRDRNQILILGAISRREELLGASNLLSVAALDEYQFVRDAYLQRRRNLIFDGNPPREKDPYASSQAPWLDGGLGFSDPTFGVTALLETTPPAPVRADSALAELPDNPATSGATADMAVLPPAAPPVIRVWLP